ncbi:hypothetical protein ABZT17_34970 [Streptomyces sp. NPDC005648]|uniref:hypothetical protein n=1 Tax=Streptomyces sp. NPDC005648 TaxID=3157044 RepID=UPI0033A2393F
MKIRMKTTVSGSRNGVPWPPRGGTVELPDDEAASMCAAGMAEPLADDEDVETATEPDDAETRALTTETAAAVTQSAPDPAPKAEPAKTAPAKTTAKKATPAKKTAASQRTADGETKA